MRKPVINNPRYPHTITIVRRNLTVSGIGADEDDPLAEPSPELIVAKPEGGVSITDDGKILIDGEYLPKEQLLYEGVGRAFTDTTTNGDVEVDTNRRKASIPVRYDEWGAGKKPLDGDTVYAKIGENIEVGRVRDCESDNDRTLVYWDYVRV